jgi:hypothetical protein
MPIWSKYALLYCVVCWFLGLILARIYAPLFSKVAEARGVSPVVSWLRTVLLAPVILPVAFFVFLKALAVGCRCHAEQIQRLAELRSVSRSYRPYEFQRVNGLQLAEPIRQHFEQHTPALIKLGYELIADFRQKPEPVEVHDRLFFSENGEVLADICALLDSGGVSFISVLANGTCVHTTSVKNPRPDRTLEAGDELVISYMPGVELPQLHLHHLETLSRLCADMGTQVMQFGREQYRELLNYDQLIFCRWRYRHGGFAEKPPAPDFSRVRGAASTAPEPIQQAAATS